MQQGILSFITPLPLTKQVNTLEIHTGQISMKSFDSKPPESLTEGDLMK